MDIPARTMLIAATEATPMSPATISVLKYSHAQVWIFSTKLRKLSHPITAGLVIMKRIVRLSLPVLATSIVLLLASTLGGCGDPYDDYIEACRLIGECRFKEARELLNGLDASTWKQGNPRVATQLCDIGQLAMAGSFDKAFARMSASDANDRYEIIVHPDDPLHAPALNVALWIKVRTYEDKILQLLALDPESEKFGQALVGLPPSAYVFEVLELPLAEYDANETRLGGDYSLPRIMQGSFATVKLLPAYAKELRGVEQRFRDYLPRLEEAETRNTAWANSHYATPETIPTPTPAE